MMENESRPREYLVEALTQEGMIRERFASYVMARRYVERIPAASLRGIPFIYRELPDGSQRLVREDGKPLQWHRLEGDADAPLGEPLPLSEEPIPAAGDAGPAIREVELRPRGDGAGWYDLEP